MYELSTLALAFFFLKVITCYESRRLLSLNAGGTISMGLTSDKDYFFVIEGKLRKGFKGFSEIKNKQKAERYVVQ